MECECDGVVLQTASECDCDGVVMVLFCKLSVNSIEYEQCCFANCH